MRMVNGSEPNNRRWKAYQRAKDDRKEVQLRHGTSEAPEEECRSSRPYSAAEHHPRVREAVAEMTEHDLTRDRGRIEDGKNSRGRKWRGDLSCEA